GEYKEFFGDHACVVHGCNSLSIPAPAVYTHNDSLAVPLPPRPDPQTGATSGCGGRPTSLRPFALFMHGKTSLAAPSSIQSGQTILADRKRVADKNRKIREPPYRFREHPAQRDTHRPPR